MKKLVVLVLVGILLCLCVQSVNPSAIKQKVVESSKGIRTYRFNMITESEVIVGNETNGVKSTTVSNVTGAMDLVNRSMVVNTSVITKRFGHTYEMRSETVVLNDTAYMKVVRPNGTVAWFKTKVGEDFWRRSDQIDQQVTLLRISKVVKVADGRVNGEDCYVLDLKPDMDKFAEFVISYSRNVPKNKTELTKIIKDVEVRMWIAKDTFYPIKTEIRTLMRFPMGISIGNLKGSLNITEKTKTVITLYDINEPVVVRIPKGAENAKSLYY